MGYAGGNVMIGASVPATGYLLSVDGKVMCEELKVQMSGSWPDYVFADDYTLPTLYELEASIKQNKHLPGIPSAAVVEAEGIEVGAMQVQMMEKIEELTLYIIELQKQIDVVLAELGSCFFGFSSESKLLHKIDYISSIFHKIHEIVLLILDKFLKMLQISFIHSELAWIWMII